MFWLTLGGDGSSDMPWWAAVLGLPAIPAFFLMLLNIFWDPKRWPPLLRPPWLPADAPVPININPMTNAALMAAGRVAETSEALATREMAGAGARKAHWQAGYIEENPAMPYLNSAMPGFRWAVLDVYERGAAVYQITSEDRLHRANFAFVFRPGDVKKIEFLPAPRLSWRMFTDAKHHMHVPRVLLHVPGATHHVAIRDGRFRRKVGSSLELLSQALGAELVR
jgi:hypothetical protein